MLSLKKCSIPLVLILTSCGTLKKIDSPLPPPNAPLKLINPTKVKASELFLKGHDCLIRGDFYRATPFFRELTHLFPNNSYLATKYAVALIYIEQFNEAKKVLQSAFKRVRGGDPSELSSTGLLLAGLHRMVGERDAAQDIYRIILQKKPHHQETCLFLAKSYSTTGHYSKAHKLLAQCAKGEGANNGVFNFFRGRLYILQKKYPLAHRFLALALRENPRFEKAVIAKGLLFIKQKKYSSATTIYKKYLEQDPYNKAVLKNITRLLFAMGDYKTVIPYAEALSYLDSTDLNLKLRLSMLYVEAKRLQDAMGSLKEILAIAPESDKIIYYLALVCSKLQLNDCAMKHFAKILPNSPYFVNSSRQMASILQKAAESDPKVKRGESEKQFIQFTSKRGKQSPQLKVEMGLVRSLYYEGQGNLAKAIDALEGLNLTEERHNYYLATLYEKAKQYTRSDKIIRQLLTENPDNALALNHLGYSLLERGKKLPLAYKYIQRAIVLMPNNGYIRDSLGWYYYKTGALKAALREMKKAQSLIKKDLVITKHLAHVYLALKKYKLAKKYYQEALKLCQFEGEKEEIVGFLNQLNQLKKGRIPTASSPWP